MKDQSKAALTLDLVNQGKAGVFFYVYDDQTNFFNEKRFAPKRYTVVTGEPLKVVLRTYYFQYGFSVYGPNGYLFRAKGACDAGVDDSIDVSVAQLKNGLTSAKYKGMGGILLKINYDGQWKDNYLKISTKYAKINTDNGNKLWTSYLVPLPKNKTKGTVELEIATLDGWYDVSVEFADPAGYTDDQFLRRYAGHMENGKPSTTDVFLTYNKMV